MFTSISPNSVHFTIKYVAFNVAFKSCFTPFLHYLNTFFSSIQCRISDLLKFIPACGQPEHFGLKSCIFGKLFAIQSESLRLLAMGLDFPRPRRRPNMHSLRNQYLFRHPLSFLW